MEHTIHLGGSCGMWLPLVRGHLAAHGFQDIQEDDFGDCGFRLTAGYSGSGGCGMISVSLVPDAEQGRTKMSVMAAADLAGASALAGNKMPMKKNPLATQKS